MQREKLRKVVVDGQNVKSGLVTENKSLQQKQKKPQTRTVKKLKSGSN